jgi:hypothetical protein
LLERDFDELIEIEKRGQEVSLRKFFKIQLKRSRSRMASVRFILHNPIASIRVPWWTNISDDGKRCREMAIEGGGCGSTLCMKSFVSVCFKGEIECGGLAW